MGGWFTSFDLTVDCVPLGGSSAQTFKIRDYPECMGMNCTAGDYWGLWQETNATFAADFCTNGNMAGGMNLAIDTSLNATDLHQVSQVTGGNPQETRALRGSGRS